MLKWMLMSRLPSEGLLALRRKLLLQGPQLPPNQQLNHEIVIASQLILSDANVKQRRAGLRRLRPPSHYFLRSLWHFLLVAKIPQLLQTPPRSSNLQLNQALARYPDSRPPNHNTHIHAPVHFLRPNHRQQCNPQAPRPVPLWGRLSTQPSSRRCAHFRHK